MKDDAAVPGSDRPSPLHIAQRLDGKDLGTHDAGRRRPTDDGDGKDDRRETASPDRDDDEDKRKPRDDQEEVVDPRDDLVPDFPVVAGGEAREGPQDDRDEGRGQSDGEGHPRPVHQEREIAAPIMVRSQRESRRRRGERDGDVRSRCVVRIRARDDGREEGHRRKDEDDDRARGSHRPFE